MGTTLMDAMSKNNGQVLVHTQSVCPVCLRRIPAVRVAYGTEVYLEKTCPDHGFSQTILWRGAPPYESWNREKNPNYPSAPFTNAERGCPFDCGPCSEHRQQPCCVLLEVTSRCDLVCPVCFASSGDRDSRDVDMQTINTWYDRMLEAGGPYNVQLSGGEPTVRNDLVQIIRIGKEKGFSYFQLNTNGLRIARDLDYLRGLKEAGLQVVYLQFDGTEDAIYQVIRGRHLLSEKLDAIRNSGKAGLGVVLVPTIVPGVNDHNLGEIIRFARSNYPVVRSIHFQPVSYFGRYPVTPRNENRITIPELFKAMEDQTDGLVKAIDFQPKGSENSYCSFHATYLILADGQLRPVRNSLDESCSCNKENAADGLARSKNFVARNWPLPPKDEVTQKSSTPSMGEWETLIERARTHLFSISGMAFQDAWNLDLQLLQDCCINVASEDGFLIPFCAYNLTNTHGEAIYRSNSCAGNE